MTKMEQSVKIDTLLQQLDELKKKLNSGDHSTSEPFSLNVSIPSPVQRPAPPVQDCRRVFAGLCFDADQENLGHPERFLL